MAEYVTEAKPAIIDQDGRTMAKVALVGAVLGLFAWALAYALEHYVLRGMLCGDATAPSCENIFAYSGNIAAVIMGVVGVVALVRIRVFRPLLIALGVVASLWGMAAWLSQLPYFEQAAWSMALYALLYSLYAWLARIRNAVVALVIFFIVVIATRVIPHYL